MKKLLFIILIALSFKALSAQRGGHFGGGHFGGEHFGGYRSNGYFSQPRITIHSAPIFRPSVPVAPRMAIREGYLPYAHRGINFYYRGGFFYDSYFNWFYPPIGFAIMTLPYGYYNFTYGGNPYYYYGGVYYIQNDGVCILSKSPYMRILTDLNLTYNDIMLYGALALANSELLGRLMHVNRLFNKIEAEGLQALRQSQLHQRCSYYHLEMECVPQRSS